MRLPQTTSRASVQQPRCLRRPHVDSCRMGTLVLLLFFALVLLCAPNASASQLPTYRDYLNATGLTDAPASAEALLVDAPNELALMEGESLQLTVNAAQAGFYHLAYSYEVMSEGLLVPEAALSLNGSQDYAELRRIIFPAMWQDQENAQLIDRLGNQHPPLQEKRPGEIAGFAMDSALLEKEPLRFYLQKGDNTLEIVMQAGTVRLSGLHFTAPTSLPSYADYAAQFAGRVNEAKGTLVTLQAEQPAYKNTTMIIPAYDSSFDVVPYETITRPLNKIDEPSWYLAGDALFYTFDVPADGFYHIAVKYKQTDKPNVRVFRTIAIDGQIPFEEAQAYTFLYAEDWQLKPLESLDGDPYSFYLHKGAHTLSFAVEASPYREVIAELKTIQQQIGAMYIDLRMVLGGEADMLRDWALADYFPQMEQQLRDMRVKLSEQSDRLVALNGGEVNSDHQAFITLAMRSLDGLLKKPNDIPKKSALFTEGSGSISQLLAKGITDIGMQAMTMDEIYIYSSDRKPLFIRKPFSFALRENAARFMATFRDPLPPVDGAEKVVLEVWVERGRTQIELMQRMVDTQFTPQTGIQVNFRQLVDDQKLTLSAMAGITPDAAINVGAGIPFEYGLRGLALDLSAFPDFGKVIGRFPLGVFPALTADEGVYGLPEAVDVQMTFYRHDLLDSLNIPVPATWDEVARIMPELQRFGMSYYTPLALGAGTKPLSATAPHIFQAGGSLYAKDAMRSAIDSEQTLSGIKRMVDLSTIYGLSLQVESFFESFRSGITPIGVSGFATYLQMRIAAPELMNSWSVAPAPGVLNDEGSINRQYPGILTTNIIFNNSKHHQEAWELLSWWSSDRTQEEYARQLALLYGPEYVFNTANTAAFAGLPISGKDKAVMLKQRENIQDVQYIPGWYMVEREISNIWNAVVFEGGKLRNEVDKARTASDREIARKMEEFGFLKGGKPIKPYHLVTLQDVKEWTEVSK